MPAVFGFQSIVNWCPLNNAFFGAFCAPERYDGMRSGLCIASDIDVMFASFPLHVRARLVADAKIRRR